MVRVKMSPDIEFKMEIELEGINYDSRDHDVQLHKEEVYTAFVEKVRTAFPDGDFTIDTFTFGLDREGAKVP